MNAASFQGDWRAMAIHGCYESVSTARHGFDVTRIFGRIAQPPTKLVHGSVEAVFEIDERPIFPDLLAQMEAAAETARRADGGWAAGSWESRRRAY